MKLNDPLAGQILRYLARHPRAEDTVEGIARWWVLEQRIIEEVTKVESALASLVAEDLVIRSQEDPEPRYRLKPDAYARAQALIEDLEEDVDG